MYILFVFSHPQFYWTWLFLALGSMVAHELAHVLVSRSCRLRGRLETGAFSTPIPGLRFELGQLTAYFVFGVSWGDYRPSPGSGHRFGRTLSTLAGPAANLALFCFCLVMLLATRGAACSPSERFWSLAAQVNLVLFVFNCLPAPPLDGWSLLEVWSSSARSLRSELRNALFTGLLLVVFASYQFILALSAAAAGLLGGSGF